MDDQFNAVPAPAPPSPTAPPVIRWFKAYCVLMMLLYLVLAGTGIAFLLVGAQIPESEIPAAIRTIYGVVFLVLGLFFAGVFVAAFFLPRKPWVWVYDLVLIILSLTGCTLVFGIPLLIFWLRPDVQSYFGR